MNKEKEPHKAVVHIRVEVHDVLPKTGELSGHIVGQVELANYGLKSSMVVCVNGDDKDDCLRKLKEKIDSFERK